MASEHMAHEKKISAYQRTAVCFFGAKEFFCVLEGERGRRDWGAAAVNSSISMRRSSSWSMPSKI